VSTQTAQLTSVMVAKVMTTRASPGAVMETTLDRYVMCEGDCCCLWTCVDTVFVLSLYASLRTHKMHYYCTHAPRTTLDKIEAH